MDWIKNNKHLTLQLTVCVLLVFGVLLMIGAVRNWDWLYQPDGHYQNNWTMGQISRYLGRNTARIIGFSGGVILTVICTCWGYNVFIK